MTNQTQQCVEDYCYHVMRDRFRRFGTLCDGVLTKEVEEACSVRAGFSLTFIIDVRRKRLFTGKLRENLRTAQLYLGQIKRDRNRRYFKNLYRKSPDMHLAAGLIAHKIEARLEDIAHLDNKDYLTKILDYANEMYGKATQLYCEDGHDPRITAEGILLVDTASSLALLRKKGLCCEPDEKKAYAREQVRRASAPAYLAGMANLTDASEQPSHYLALLLAKTVLADVAEDVRAASDFCAVARGFALAEENLDEKLLTELNLAQAAYNLSSQTIH